MNSLAVASVHPVVVALVLLLAMTVVIELGYRWGLRARRNASNPDSIAQHDVTVGAMLALVGLLLAFTYSFSLSRADLRKDSLLAETNALGTAFLRADLAGATAGGELRQALYEYARSRVVDPEKIVSPQDQAEHIARSEATQSALWPATRKALDSGMSPELQNGLVQSITELLDLHSVRLAHFADRLPAIVFWLQVLVAAAALGVAAHDAGLAGHISRKRMWVFASVLSALIAVIIDFDQPRRGSIIIDQTPLQMTIENMHDTLVAERKQPD